MSPTLIPIYLSDSSPQARMTILGKSLLFCWAGISDRGLLSRAEKAWEFKYTVSDQAYIRMHAVAQRQSWDHRGYQTQRAWLLSLTYHYSLT